MLSGGPSGRLDLYASDVPFSSNVVNDRCIEMKRSRVHAFPLHQGGGFAGFISVLLYL